MIQVLKRQWVNIDPARGRLSLLSDEDEARLFDVDSFNDHLGWMKITAGPLMCPLKIWLWLPG